MSKDKAVVYEFVGDGLGIPGLAREITLEQAQANGVGALLADAIASGVYVEKQAEKAAGKGK